MARKPTAERVTRRHLYRLAYNLNIKHNVDRPDAGFLDVERHYAGHRDLFRCTVRSGVGNIVVTGWGAPKEVIAELRAKDWRRVLLVAKADNDNALPNRRNAG